MTAWRGVRLRIGLREDADAIEELAALGGGHAPARPLLIAVADGEVSAALSLSTGEVIADPTRPSAGLLDLLRERATELTG
jgi:hypothetical protein